MAKTIQDEELDKAIVKLGEHFENVVIICDAQDVEFPDEDSPSIFTRRKGSTWTLIGMMTIFKSMLLENFLKTKDRGDDN